VLPLLIGYAHAYLDLDGRPDEDAAILLRSSEHLAGISATCVAPREKEGG
jgi:hypothetical protein